MPTPRRLLVAAGLAATAALAIQPASAQQPAPLPAAATGPITERNISLSLAHQAVMVAVENCWARGYRVTATIVDRHGVVKAVARADGATFWTLDSAERKALTSANFRAPTGRLAEGARNSPAVNVGQIGRSLLLQGGVPIAAGGEVIGAIGVGGAPSGQIDEECGQAGIEAVRARLQ